MTELGYLNRVAQLGCDTCCITIESDGSRTHEPTCQLNSLRAIVEQAKKAILAAGHRATPRCNMLDMRATCNCGAVETFKIESGEFWRLIQQLTSSSQKVTQ